MKITGFKNRQNYYYEWSHLPEIPYQFRNDMTIMEKIQIKMYAIIHGNFQRKDTLSIARELNTNNIY